MRLYSYKCRTCGIKFDLTVNNSSVLCPDPFCYTEGEHGTYHSKAKRDYSTVQLSTPTFTPHFNHTVGQHVSSSREFDDALKRRSAEQSERTGMDHSYARLDPGDMPRPSADDTIYETRGKFLRDNGYTSESGKLVKPLPS